MVSALTAAPELLGLSQVTKVYGTDIHALRGVDLSTQSGLIHGLVGANGAGKSTLIKIMSGAVAPTSGEIRWFGERRGWSRPGEALAAGIATVHQHSPLVETVSVLENVFLPRRGDWKWSARNRIAEFQKLCEAVGYELPPNRLVADLAIGDRQMVAILQAISQQPRLLILDEPTASLSASEREIVHHAMRRLTEQGSGILFVSHLLPEILSLTSKVTVLRDGRITLNASTSDLTHDALVAGIVGRELQELEQSSHRVRRAPKIGPRTVLEVDGLTSPGKVHDVSLSVAAGEVLGLAGLLGSGRSEILHAIYRADPAARGTVRIDGSVVRRSPVAAVRAGMALVPEDREKQGLIAGWEIWRNVTLPFVARHSRSRSVPRKAEEMAQGTNAVRELGIHPPRPDVIVDELSGGNAQKTVFAKWLHEHVRILLLDEPGAGVDIGAKGDIQVLIHRLTEQGIGVIVVDSELDELLAVSDRVLVVRGGQIVAERVAADTTENELLTLASGLEQGGERRHATV
jgi:ribose transport system ATP-binding protein